MPNPIYSSFALSAAMRTSLPLVGLCSAVVATAANPFMDDCAEVSFMQHSASVVRPGSLERHVQASAGARVHHVLGALALNQGQPPAAAKSFALAGPPAQHTSKVARPDVQVKANAPVHLLQAAKTGQISGFAEQAAVWVTTSSQLSGGTVLLLFVLIIIAIIVGYLWHNNYNTQAAVDEFRGHMQVAGRVAKEQTHKGATLLAGATSQQQDTTPFPARTMSESTLPATSSPPVAGFGMGQSMGPSDTHGSQTHGSHSTSKKKPCAEVC